MPELQGGPAHVSIPCQKEPSEPRARWMGWAHQSLSSPNELGVVGSPEMQIRLQMKLRVQGTPGYPLALSSLGLLKFSSKTTSHPPPSWAVLGKCCTNFSFGIYVIRVPLYLCCPQSSTERKEMHVTLCIFMSRIRHK